MFNVIELQDKLKNFSEDQLANEMQSPSGGVPQYLVLSEFNRRKRVKDDYQQQQNAAQKDMTVAEEVLAGAGVPQGGLSSLATSMAPKTDMLQNAGAMPQQSMPMPQAPVPMAEAMPDEVMGMASGGHIQRMNVGGLMSLTSPDDAAMSGAGQYNTGSGRATVVNGRLVELLDNGMVVDARTGDPVSEDLSRAAMDKLTFSAAEQIADSELYDQAMEVPSGYRPEVGMPSQEDLDFMYDTDTRNEALGIGIVPSTMGEPSGSTAVDFDATSVGAEDFSAPDMPTSYGSLGEDGPVPSGYGGFRSEGQTVPSGIPEGIGPTGASDYGSIYDLLGSSGVPNYDPDLLDRLNMQDFGTSLEVPEGGISELVPPPVGSLPEGRTIPSGYGSYQEPDDESLYGSLDSVELRPEGQTIPSGYGPYYEGADLSDLYSMQDSGNPLEIPEGGMSELMPPSSSLEFPVGDDASDMGLPTEFQMGTVAPSGASRSASGSGASGSGASGSGASGAGSPVDSQILEMLKDREERASSDKWLSLARAGMALMSSKNPTLLGALGEAGNVGLESLNQSRDDYESAKFDLLTMQQKMAAARAKGSSGKGKSELIANIRARLKDLREEAGKKQDIVTNEMGETEFVDFNTPQTLAKIASLENQLESLILPDLGPQFDATAPIASAVNSGYSMGTPVSE